MITPLPRLLDREHYTGSAIWSIVTHTGIHIGGRNIVIGEGVVVFLC